MTTFSPIPVIIPVNSNSNPECPNCHKPEDIIEVCKHCGYHYPEEEYKTPVSVKILLVVVCALIVSVLSLIADNLTGNHLLRYYYSTRTTPPHNWKGWIIQSDGKGDYIIGTAKTEYDDSQWLQLNDFVNDYMSQKKDATTFKDSTEAYKCAAVYLLSQKADFK